MKTGLYDFHVSNGAKMVPFAGFSMPLQYGSVGAGTPPYLRDATCSFIPPSPTQSGQPSPCTKLCRSLRCRSHGSIKVCILPFKFPRVSLTACLSFRGPTATAFLEWLTPSSLKSLAPYTSTLSVLLNERGGIIDDTVITKHAEDAFYVVTNAGRRDRDLAWFAEKLAEWNAGDVARAQGGVEHEILDGWGLLALQGARATTCAFTSVVDTKRLPLPAMLRLQVRNLRTCCKG